MAIIQWEYKIERPSRDIFSMDLHKDLREAGRDGWELVSMVTSITETRWVMVFKRPKP